MRIRRLKSDRTHSQIVQDHQSFQSKRQSFRNASSNAQSESVVDAGFQSARDQSIQISDHKDLSVIKDVSIPSSVNASFKSLPQVSFTEQAATMDSGKSIASSKNISVDKQMTQIDTQYNALNKQAIKLIGYHDDDLVTGAGLQNIIHEEGVPENQKKAATAAFNYIQQKGDVAFKFLSGGMAELSKLSQEQMDDLYGRIGPALYLVSRVSSAMYKVAAPTIEAGYDAINKWLKSGYEYGISVIDGVLNFGHDATKHLLALCMNELPAMFNELRLKTIGITVQSANMLLAKVTDWGTFANEVMFPRFKKAYEIGEFYDIANAASQKAMIQGGEIYTQLKPLIFAAQTAITNQIAQAQEHHERIRKYSGEDPPKSDPFLHRIGASIAKIQDSTHQMIAVARDRTRALYDIQLRFRTLYRAVESKYYETQDPYERGMIGQMLNSHDIRYNVEIIQKQRNDITSLKNNLYYMVPSAIPAEQYRTSHHIPDEGYSPALDPHARQEVRRMFQQSNLRAAEQNAAAAEQQREQRNEQEREEFRQRSNNPATVARRAAIVENARLEEMNLARNYNLDQQRKKAEYDSMRKSEQYANRATQPKKNIWDNEDVKEEQPYQQPQPFYQSGNYDNDPYSNDDKNYGEATPKIFEETKQSFPTRLVYKIMKTLDLRQNRKSVNKKSKGKANHFADDKTEVGDDDNYQDIDMDTFLQPMHAPKARGGKLGAKGFVQPALIYATMIDPIGQNRFSQAIDKEYKRYGHERRAARVPHIVGY